ncbi:nucleolar zinc-finger protein, partial [Spiromyces aspiralis]
MSHPEDTTKQQDKGNDKLFGDLNAESTGREIESLCMNCHKNASGVTRLLLTRIPHFKDVILMAFECPHCGFRNNEIQSGEAIQEKGIEYTCNVDSREDLDRQVVRSEHSSIVIPDVELEVPGSRRAQLTTIEGLLQGIVSDLSMDQEKRKKSDPNIYEAIEGIIAKLNGYLENKTQFSIKIRDPSGNSYIENLNAPNVDPKLHVKYFKRNKEQNQALGLLPPEEEEEREQKAREQLEKTLKEATQNDEIITFPANCSSCNAPSETRMKLMDIPHFKEVIVMSTTCDSCGYKSNEVKSGGAVAPKGKRITLKMTDMEDLSRDLLKSETSGLSIPEIDLDLTPGTLGGRFTTVEGLLRQVHDELKERAPFIGGDSASEERKQRFNAFLDKLERVINSESFPCTLILDDP